jgi:hypothetical protein
MYSEVIPKYAAEKTISDPDEPAEVIGFEARNVRLGKEAVILKGSEVIQEHQGAKRAEIPCELTDRIVADRLEFAILGDDVVWCMNGMDLHTTTTTVVKPSGDESAREYLPLDSANIRSFYRYQVEVQ